MNQNDKSKVGTGLAGLIGLYGLAEAMVAATIAWEGMKRIKTPFPNVIEGFVKTQLMASVAALAIIPMINLAFYVKQAVGGCNRDSIEDSQSE